MSSPSELKRGPESAIRDRPRSPPAHPQAGREQGTNLTAFIAEPPTPTPRPTASLPHEQDSAAFTADCDLSAPGAFGPGPDAATRPLSPPPVDPAQPPINAEHNSSTGRNNGQRAILSVVKPAVVAIETTWKKA